MGSPLLDRAPRQAIPLVSVAKPRLASWMRQQSAVARRWLEAQAFDAAPGRFCAVPDAKGGVAFVAVGLSDPVSLWDLSGLPFALPHGSYVWEKSEEPRVVEKLALGWLLGARPLHHYKTSAAQTPSELAFATKVDLTRVRRLAEAMGDTRDLISRTAEDLTPETFAALVKKTGKAAGAKIVETVGDALLTKGFEAIHAVGRASVHAPRLLDLRWGSKGPALTLVGKGVCFDTGGLHLKPGKSMDLMRKDMAGAACALALASLIMQDKMPVRLRLLLPLVENAIGGNAFRPSDVIKMRAGFTAEVGSTDAEGRLVTGDALAEAAHEKPDLVMDFTTLGAARGIFGPESAALYTNVDALAAKLMQAAGEEEEGLWRLPLAEAYEPWLESSLADVTTCPDKPYGGAITSALFLQRCVGKKQPWVHLDFMAWNTASRPGRPAGGEAMTLRTAYRFVQEWARKG